MRITRTAILLFALLVGCNDTEETKEKLVEDYELIGGRKSATFYGSYTVYKGGEKAGLLELSDERIKFTSFDSDGRLSGQVETPIVRETDAGSSALIFVPDSNGDREGHQLIEEKIVGFELDPDYHILKGSVVHGGPYKEESNKAEMATPRKLSD